MFELTVELAFSAAHCIKGHPGPCAELHGHNYRVVATAAGESLNDHGMVVDFGDLKRVCGEAIAPLDHTYLNDLPAFAEVNPTAEAIARHLYRTIAEGVRSAAPGVRLAMVTVYESDRSYATYRE